ncbi:MAG: HAD family phosphatase, partial [Gemmobacter sp.]|nr:HAD family phosphatase [Gemmobacter sp.]
MSVDAVVFDIGNVLIEWNPERFYDAEIGRARRTALFAAVNLHRMNDLIDAGAPFRETVKDWAGRHPGWAAEILLWHDRWIDMAAPRIEGTVVLLRALRRRGMPVFALTNFGIGSFDIACRHYDFLTEFDRVWASGHLRLMKPDPAIYAALEAECGMAPG